jgi:predicted GNAT family acetyltransferase
MPEAAVIHRNRRGIDRMSVRSSQNYFSLKEYFALEKASERRWEYWDGEVVCMSGGSAEHGLIARISSAASIRRVRGQGAASLLKAFP